MNSSADEWVNFVSTASDGMTAGAYMDWNELRSRVSECTDEKVASIVLRATNKQGHLSSAIHYGGGWVMSTSHAFPDIGSLMGACFTCSDGAEFTVDDITRFFLVRAEEKLYPDLLFIELRGLGGDSVTTLLEHLGAMVDRAAEGAVYVYAHWHHEDGAFKLLRSEGTHIEVPGGQRTDPGSMFWHSAPTRWGASGGIVIDSTGFIGMCLGGIVCDATKNIALRYQPSTALPASAPSRSSFPGIEKYIGAGGLLTKIAILRSSENLKNVYDDMQRYEETLAEPKAGAMTAADMHSEFQAACDTFLQKLVVMCSDFALPGLVVHSEGIEFHIPTQVVHASESNSAGESDDNYQPFSMRSITPGEREEWSRLGHVILERDDVIAKFKAAAKVLRSAAALLKELEKPNVQCISEIRAGLHTGGKTTKDHDPDPNWHFGVRVYRPGGYYWITYHVHVDKDTGNITGIPPNCLQTCECKLRNQQA